MNALALHECHGRLQAQFSEVNGMEVVARYGDPLREHRIVREAAGVLDLSYRSRLCVLGADRKKFLHGQVTNNVSELEVGQGCYAALVTAKGKLQSDLFIYCLPDELLSDFEPGLSTGIVQRLEKYIIADDVQVMDVGGAYGHLSVQGPVSPQAVSAAVRLLQLPSTINGFVHLADAARGDIYVMNRPRTGGQGFDLFVPIASLQEVFNTLLGSVRPLGGAEVGWDALEIARVEAAIPRFGCDMDESNLPPEAGLESHAISYTKGCYIGQEVIARIRTYGQVAKALRGLKVSGEAQVLPKKGDRVLWGDKEIGYVTTAIASPALKTNLALAYLRRERNQVGADVTIQTEHGLLSAVVKTVPFQPFTLD